MTTIFVICAVAGFTIAIIGAVFDGLFDSLDAFDVLPEWLSLPVLGAGIGAFGVAGLAVGGTDADGPVALIAAIVVGLLFAGGAAWLTLALSRTHTDATPTAASVVGSTGRIVTPIPAGGRGEVVLTVGGHTFKLAASSAESLEVGASVVAIESVSETSVIVMSSEQFWGPDTP